MSIKSEFWQQHTLANRLQSILLFIIMLLFLALLGWLLWGNQGVFWLLLTGIILLYYNPAASPRLIMHLYRATPLTSTQAPMLNSILNELALLGGLKRVPTLFYIPSSMVNAFTVGNRNEAGIAITDGLLHTLSRREIISVLAHEISHVRNNDIWVMAVADLISRLTGLLSLFGQILLLLNLPLILLTPNVSINWFAILLLILAPNLSALAQLGLSRMREYNADLGAVRLTGDPQGLASALLRIEQKSGSLFENILLPGRRNPEPSLLRSHPPTDERIRRLIALKPAMEKRAQASEQADLFHNERPGHLVKRKPKWHISGLWH
ncbi:MAG: M48 family metalloprotease [gamma proteobacterium symbiont of Bathyaustriella thionipta]|nr:M48 family metalloprotease [gamma proteobacterium symbiont of Bathyaustriella thionipta]MCU7951409.1 M48 family metalloprotease [gamma proteobacterium symbiont of Bathyaustriella thionipta]MCU7952505.1 M48 family metalloprotease [gamma proteobacterium symbiont of Bathyaustriella thionipta]MCU7957959.1 M48 family metalloprotease [gamma proteobacterium symbiont of Bathyaustriella thionipta]MCU7968685.1 M48 family metalloprotease [gamma proteobacterium symbiont of Bathyaustriella thionipta]